jgi:capsular polysaccharide transport system permease protein
LERLGALDAFPALHVSSHLNERQLMEKSFIITEASRHALRLQSSALARELKLAAREARRNQSPILYRVLTIALGGALLVRDSVGRGLLMSFVVVALVPSLLLVGYFVFVASSQYESVAKFAIRTGEPSLFDAAAAAIGMASMQQAQDTLIVADYLKSRALVEELDRRVDLRGMFSSPHIDFFSRFKSNGSIEDLTRYWHWKIHVSIEYNSGIVTVETYAFSPGDALKLAQTVVTLSENLINTMSDRAQRDLVSQSEKELARVESRLRQATVTMTTLRNQEGLIDPHLQAQAINKLIDEIKLERLKMQQDVTGLAQSRVEQSPQVKILRLRIEAADEQIARLESQLTNENKGDTATISHSISRFDDVELERQVAEKQYFLVSSNLEAARIAAERQRLYVSTFVSPLLAQESNYPYRTLFSFLGVYGSFSLWMICIAIWIPIRSHLRARARP